MTTPAAELNKALWLDKTAFGHLKKTEQDVDKLRAALPKEVQASLVLSNRVDLVTPDLIYAITVHLNKEKEAGRSWPSRATRDQARKELATQALRVDKHWFVLGAAPSC